MRSVTIYLLVTFSFLMQEAAPLTKGQQTVRRLTGGFGQVNPDKPGGPRGKWVAQIPGRGGQTAETTFKFAVEGNKLTGMISGGQGDTPISDGKVSGNEISFKVTRSIQGNEITVVYKGKVERDEIKFARTIEGREGPPTEFTAKRAKE